MPTPEPSTFETALKVVQIVFYATGTVLALLTYRAARRGLLNTVNTEYQKRVMDRLHKLSEDLYSEFDLSADTHWAGSKPVHKAVEHINEVFETHRAEILAQRKFYYGPPMTEDTKRIRNLLAPAVSDPFIPENIRSAVVDLLENRLRVMDGIYSREFERYADGLAKGKKSPLTDLDDINRIHNSINHQLYEQGCGIAQIEAEVHKMRGLIQGYFESFNPHRGWWNRRVDPRRRDEREP